MKMKGYMIVWAKTEDAGMRGHPIGLITEDYSVTGYAYIYPDIYTATAALEGLVILGGWERSKFKVVKVTLTM